MSALLKTLGGILLLFGVVWAITIIVAVATQREGFSTLKEITPGLIFHAASLLVGMVLMGLGQKLKRSARAA